MKSEADIRAQQYQVLLTQKAFEIENSLTEDAKAIVNNNDFRIIAGITALQIALVVSGFAMVAIGLTLLAAVGIIGWLYAEWFMDWMDENVGSILDVEEDEKSSEN